MLACRVAKTCSTAAHPSSGLGKLPVTEVHGEVVRPKRNELRRSSCGAPGVACSCRARVDAMTASAAITRKSASDTSVQKLWYTSWREMPCSPVTRHSRKPALSGSPRLKDLVQSCSIETSYNHFRDGDCSKHTLYLVRGPSANPPTTDCVLGRNATLPPYLLPLPFPLYGSRRVHLDQILSLSGNATRASIAPPCAHPSEGHKPSTGIEDPSHFLRPPSSWDRVTSARAGSIQGSHSAQVLMSVQASAPPWPLAKSMKSWPAMRKMHPAQSA